jgi:putative Mn2+ efflux pump MntP
MNLTHAIALSFGLSVDTFLASMTQGNFVRQKHWRESLKISFSFAFFHGLMPTLGWLMARHLGPNFESIDHWIIFGLFFYLGGKLIWDSFQKVPLATHLSFSKIMLLSVATSLDALLVGVSLSIMKWEIITPALLMSATTWLASMVGFWAGKHFRKLQMKGMEIMGGLILIFLGLKILYTHLF